MSADYEIEPRNRFFEAIKAIAEHEIRPGNTVSFQAEVDLTEVDRIRAESGTGEKPSYTAFVAKSVSLALVDFPYANRRVVRFPFVGPRLQRFSGIDVAVAVERDIPGSEASVFIEILRGADRRTLAEITAALRALSTCDESTNLQWRQFSWAITRLPAWLSRILIRLPLLVPALWVKYRGGAVMISSPAKYGVDVVIGTWTHPLGVSFGLVGARPVVRVGAVVPCSTFFLTMNFDRRVMAGAQAARFFRRIVENLERAETVMAPYLFPVQAELVSVENESTTTDTELE